MEDYKQIENTLKGMFPLLVSKYKVKNIGIFGSFLHGSANQNSDIDILVDFEETPGWEFFDLLEYLESQFGRKVDLVTPNALRNPLKSKILNQVKYVS